MNTTGVKFINTAGKKEVNGTPIDDFLSDELKEAGIEIVSYEILRNSHPEVKTAIRGQLHGWTFRRAWYYWMCEGPGINNKEAEELLRSAISELRLSARAYHKVLKIARTIADLAGADRISPNHLSEAIQYRLLDRTV